MVDKEKVTKFLIGLRAVLITIVAIFTIITIITIVQKKRDARPFNHYDFSESLAVNNMTDYDKVDTLSLYLAHQILGLDTLNLIVVYIPEHINEGETEYYGIVQQLPFKKNQFIILLNKNKMSLTKLKETLSHEFVHIQQYISGDLVVYPLYAIYKGEDVYLKEIDYEDRPFEKDAFSKQHKYKRELDKLLYD